MTRASSLRRKAVALLLAALFLPGARVHARHQACGATKVYHGPARSFKAVARAVTEKVTGVKRARRAPRTLGERKGFHTASDLCGLRVAKAVPVVPARCVPVTLAAVSRRPHPEASRPLSVRQSPSPPLLTRN